MTFVWGGGETIDQKLLDFERYRTDMDRQWAQQQYNLGLAEQKRQFDLLQGREDSRLGLDRDRLLLDRDTMESRLELDRYISDADRGELSRQFDITSGRRDAFLSALGLAPQPASGFGQMGFDEDGMDPTSGGMLGGMAPPSGDMPMSQMGFGGTLDNLLGSAPSTGYTELLNEQRQITDQLLGQVNQFGESQRAALNRGFDATLGSTIANMEQRGLGASNLMGSATAAVEAERQQANLNLEDQLLGRKIDTIQGQYGDIFNTMRGEMDRELQRRQSGTGLLGDIAGSLF